jgi:hypothetical protein
MVFVCISSGGRQALAPTAETWFSDDDVIIHLPALFDKPWGKSWNPQGTGHHSQAPWWVSALSSWSCWSWYKDASNDFQAPRRRERWITCSRCSLQQYWDIKVSKAIGSTIIHHTKFWPFFLGWHEPSTCGWNMIALLTLYRFYFQSVLVSCIWLNGLWMV